MMNPSRRTVLKAGLAGAVSLPALRAARAAGPVTLRAVMQGDLRSFDPVWTTANISAYYGAMVYDTLFAVDANYDPQPQMVGKWDLSEDKKTYTFQLRDGLGWQDGTPVTAVDCVASIRRWAVRNSGGQAIMQHTEDLSAKNDKTIVLKLKEPFGLVITALATCTTPICFMMPKKDAETDPFQQVSGRIGSGPFTFNQNLTRPGSRYVYDKWDKYVPRKEAPSGLAGGKVVHLDQVIWENIADEQTASAALNAGEIDFYELPPLDILPQLTSNPDIKTKIMNPTGYDGIMRLNCLHPPFDNVKARQAMLYLVDQKAILNATFGNPKYYHPNNSIFGYNTPMSNDAGTDWFKAAPDSAKAKQLFQESGYKGDPVVVLQATDFAFMNNSAQLIAGWLQNIGVNAELAAMTWGEVITRRASMKPDNQGGWDIFITYGGGFDYSNPITLISLAANGKKGWFGWPENAEYEKLRMDWAAAPTVADQKAIAAKMQAIAWENALWVMLGEWTQPVAMRKNVGGFLTNPDVIPFWNVTKT
ncbi:MAG: ABC transporter substrate-binding protein [Acetobacteraceae bacterium]|nr:ABC transporter substrate-binding protein [Acetobacteraceae bacterium]